MQGRTGLNEQKQGLHVSICSVFPENIGEQQKRSMLFVVVVMTALKINKAQGPVQLPSLPIG